jgi:predicted helicase
MRQSLLKTFDEIYILDLHGNSKKKETCPDDSVDQNVFDIQQGVAIGIFIKYQNSQQESATVYHADLWGKREIFENKQLVGGKYHWLDESDISSMISDANKLQPDAPFYLFKPQNIDLRAEYDKYWKIDELVLIKSIGLNSHRDHFVIDFEENILKERIHKFINASNDAECYEKFDLQDSKDWKLSNARKLLRSLESWDRKIISCLYRPFDKRYCFLSDAVMDRPRMDINSHLMNKENISLITTRQTRENFAVLTTDLVCGQHKIVSVYDGSYIFPLYLYPTNTPTLFEIEPTNSPNGRRPNLAPEFINELSQKLGLEFLPDGKGDQVKTFAPEDIFNYIYATFHSPTYRQRYAEFLKIDFPRVPLTSNKQLFWELANKGDKLVQLHLMKDTGTEISSYPESGSNLVEQIKYNETKQQIWINSEQYFDHIPPHIWNFHIGGYQVCQKWLKDRKGRELSFDDLVHYQNIISILSETIEIMNDIDQIITKHGGFPFS